jgi:pyruvate,water dikinase
VLALGRKLVAAGVILEPNDAFYLDLEELQAAAKAPQPGVRGLIAARKAELARQETLQAPAFIGSPMDPADMPQFMQRFARYYRGAGVDAAPEPRTLKGNAASSGVARGRARVILDLADANRLEPGDILVCTTTAPPWTPLFAIAAAVVTDTGGILSHSAICAREYGIPCVAGAAGATRAISDGAIVSVDGSSGTVTVE